MNLPKHNCGLFLTHNEHRNYYQSLDEWTEERREHYGWQSEAAKAAALTTGECWTLQWYPITPIGFYAIAAPTLEELLEFAREIEAEDLKSEKGLQR